VLHYDNRQCSAPAILTDSSGIIPSQITDETGCGSVRFPWMLSAMNGQTIRLSIVDFGSELVKRQNNSKADIIYGYIKEAEIRTPFGSNMKRERELYQSKGNQLTLEILPYERRRGVGFFIRYQSRCIVIIYCKYDNTSDYFIIHKEIYSQPPGHVY